LLIQTGVAHTFIVLLATAEAFILVFLGCCLPQDGYVWVLGGLLGRLLGMRLLEGGEIVVFSACFAFLTPALIAVSGACCIKWGWHMIVHTGFAVWFILIMDMAYELISSGLSVRFFLAMGHAYVATLVLKVG